MLSTNNTLQNTPPGCNQCDSNSPYQFLQVILEVSKEQDDRTINKPKIHAPFKPFHYAFPPSISQCFSAYTRSSVSFANSLHVATGYPKHNLNKTVSTGHLRFQFREQESKTTLIEVPYKQVSQPHLSRILRFKRSIADLNLQILDPCLIFKRLKVERHKKSSDAEPSSKDRHLVRVSQSKQMNNRYVYIKSQRLCVFTFVDLLSNALLFKSLSQSPYI